MNFFIFVRNYETRLSEKMDLKLTDKLSNKLSLYKAVDINKAPRKRW